MVFPVIIGDGRRIFPASTADNGTFQLADAKTFSSGIVVHTYAPAGS